MDNLVLTRIAIELASELRDAVLEELRQQSADRFRLVFASGSGPKSLAVSLHPELPWIGRPALRWDGPVWSPDPFFAEASRALTGRRIAGVTKPASDRSIRFDFGDGAGLAVELATHGANAIVLAAGGNIASTLRHPKRDASRLARGTVWEPRAVPAGKLDPFGASAAAIDGFLRDRTSDGRPVFEALRRDVAGIGSAGAELVLAEAAARDLSPGAVLRERLDALFEFRSAIVIEGSGDPSAAARSGAFRSDRYRLLPWRPFTPKATAQFHDAGSDVATAGLFHDAVESEARTAARLVALRGIVRNELRRTREAAVKVRAAVASFAGPERHARLGEALLAGLASARRAGDTVLVPDPYDPEAREIAIPAPPGRPLTQVADDLFQRGRRARRGHETASARALALAERARSIEGLDALGERVEGAEGVATLEAAMRALRFPIGLLRATKAGRAAGRAAPPKLDGIRMMESAEGWSILVGRTGRDNDRLTFKIAAPDDIWLHASGVPGAHVVIRNPERRSSIPEGTLAAAARAAAWYSDAKTESFVDVHWTRRKNVRRAKGGSSGSVVLKRFETIRVKPQPPADDGEGSPLPVRG